MLDKRACRRTRMYRVDMFAHRQADISSIRNVTEERASGCSIFTSSSLITRLSARQPEEATRLAALWQTLPRFLSSSSSPLLVSPPCIFFIFFSSLSLSLFLSLWLVLLRNLKSVLHTVPSRCPFLFLLLTSPFSSKTVSPRLHSFWRSVDASAENLGDFEHKCS